MLELRDQEGLFSPGFAGDVVNFAIYLKRLLPTSTVHLLSAVGGDAISNKMCDFLEEEGVEIQLVSVSPDKTIGLYMIETDERGERYFSYWRSDSAARKMFLLADSERLNVIAADISYFYFSGITLAILDQESRDRLLDLAVKLRAEGKKIIFDPNYRANLWSSLKLAREQTIRAYKITDMLLTSHEDERFLFGMYGKQEAIKRLCNYGIEEVIMTDGPSDITAVHLGQLYKATPKQAAHVVDTTAAGDSFKAGYIAARYSGAAPDKAMISASALSARVVAHPGAIIPTS